MSSPTPIAIPAPPLVLVSCTLRQFDALIEGDGIFAERCSWSVEPGYLEWPAAVIVGREALLHDPERAGWWCYLAIHQRDQRLVGFGGYKGAPKDRQVEIGYCIAPGYRRRGLGLAFARGLAQHAFATAAVDRVLAHTLPEMNPSTRLLQRLGFAHTASPDDPVGGLQWRWELTRDRADV